MTNRRSGEMAARISTESALEAHELHPELINAFRGSTLRGAASLLRGRRTVADAETTHYTEPDELPQVNGRSASNRLADKFTTALKLD